MQERSRRRRAKPKPRRVRRTPPTSLSRTRRKRRRRWPPPPSVASAQQTASVVSADEADADRRRRSVLKAWLGAVSAELNRRRIYPAAARDKGITGAVRVAFGVDATGRISHYEIVGSSGHSILDDAVRRMMTNVRTPPPPDGSFETAVTIRFGLR